MLARIRARDYRLLHRIDQGLNSFHVLVGDNVTGKSTFLDVPRLLGAFVREGGQRATAMRAPHFDDLIFGGGVSGAESPGQFAVALELTLPPDIAARVGYGLVGYEVEFGQTQTGDVEIRSETVELKTPQAFQGNGQLNRLKADIGNTGDYFGDSRVILRRTDRQSIRCQSEVDAFGQTIRMPSPDESGLSAHVALRGAIARDVDRFPAALWLAAQLSTGIRHIQLNIDKMRAPVSPLSPRYLLGDGSNLALVIQGLQWRDEQNGTTMFEDWQRHVRTVLRDLDYVFVYGRPDDRRVGIEVKYTSSEARVPARLLSDGTLRLFALTLIPYLDEADVIYEIEEPERDIHPLGIEAVFQSLSSVYRGQVLITTYSPVFLDLTRPQDILCFTRSDADGTTIVPGNEHPMLKDWHGEIELSMLYTSGALSVPFR